MKMPFRSILVVASVALCPGFSNALLVQIGTEFQVNTTTTGD